MRKYAAALLITVLLGCTHNGISSQADREREYASAAVTLSDFSIKIIAYYQARNLPIPENFDSQQFFELLKKIYPDQARVDALQDKYRISARSLNGGYSVMLCDPGTNVKIMEDLSCHLNRVEIRSWQDAEESRCTFTPDWKHYCQQPL